MSDALNCPNHGDDDKKMKVIQGAPFIHEGVLAYWRRKRCLDCGHIMKTVEVPASLLAKFYTAPESKDMTNG